MFRKNKNHLQGNIFSFQEGPPKTQQNLLYKSEEYKFYELIFCNIDEEIFKCLYSEVESRPNAPINTMVASLVSSELIAMRKETDAFNFFLKDEVIVQYYTDIVCHQIFR